MDYNELALMADDSMVPDITEPERSALDKERKDLLDKGDMLKIFRYLLDEQIPKEEALSAPFYASTSKGMGSTFFQEGDEESLLTRLEMSILLTSMSSPRSEKQVSDYVSLNELRALVLANIRKSQGFKSTRTNLLTIFSTIFKHNIHSMMDQSPSRGIMGGLGRMFGKV